MKTKACEKYIIEADRLIKKAEQSLRHLRAYVEVVYENERLRNRCEMLETSIYSSIKDIDNFKKPLDTTCGISRKLKQILNSLDPKVEKGERGKQF